MDTIQASFLASDIQPQLIYSMYWDKKEKFLLYEDTYRQWAMIVVKEGSFYYEIGDNKGTAGYGDIVVCPPHTPFRRVVIAPLTFLMARFEWENALGERAGAPDTNALPIGKASIRNTQRLFSSCELIGQAQSRNDDWHARLRTHYLRDIWLLYFNEAVNDGAWEQGDFGQGQPEPLMLSAISLMERKALQPIQLKELAHALGLSPAQLTKKFKKAFGVSPIQHITALRLKKAKSLLLETKMTLEQISECCGYPNGFYLNRVFMKHMNETPSQYRTTHRL